MSSRRKQLSLKRNLFTVHVSFSEWNCVLVRMLTATSVSHPSPLYFPLPPSFRHFTSVLAQDPGGLQNGPRVWHRRRTLTSCRTRCRASCRRESFPPQVTHTDLLPCPSPFLQQPAAHPLNGTLQNLTALIQTTSQNHWPSRPTPLLSQQAPHVQPQLQNKLEWRVVLLQIVIVDAAFCLEWILISPIKSTSLLYVHRPMWC